MLQEDQETTEQVMEEYHNAALGLRHGEGQSDGDEKSHDPPVDGAG